MSIKLLTKGTFELCCLQQISQDISLLGKTNCAMIEKIPSNKTKPQLRFILKNKT